MKKKLSILALLSVFLVSSAAQAAPPTHIPQAPDLEAHFDPVFALISLYRSKASNLVEARLATVLADREIGH